MATLRARGVHVLDPAAGRLTGSDTGPGRLPEPEEIAAAALALVDATGRSDLAGRHVVVSAGGTREPLDPVRFLGNRSSGRQGVALAQDRPRPRGPGHARRRELDVPVPAGRRRRRTPRPAPSCGTPCAPRPRTPTSS